VVGSERFSRYRCAYTSNSRAEDNEQSVQIEGSEEEVEAFQFQEWCPESCKLSPRIVDKDAENVSGIL
jgi:hypothetical protein